LASAFGVVECRGDTLDRPVEYQGEVVDGERFDRVGQRGEHLARVRVVDVVLRVAVLGGAGRQCHGVLPVVRGGPPGRSRGARVRILSEFRDRISAAPDMHESVVERAWAKRRPEANLSTQRELTEPQRRRDSLDEAAAKAAKAAKAAREARWHSPEMRAVRDKGAQAIAAGGTYIGWATSCLLS
jgi:hypothetical protein